MVKLGFKLLKPTMDLSTNVNLWWNLWNPEYVAGFNALNKWANEYLPFPGEFFRQWVKEFYQQNKLVKGELVMGGPAGQALRHRLPGARRGGEGRQYRAARLREGADGRGVEHGQGVSRAPGRPYLAHRRPGRFDPLLAQGRRLAGGPVVEETRHGRDGRSAALRSLEEQVEEGSQAWLRTLGQGQPADPQSFWRPFMDQGMAAWSKLMTQGPPSADLMGQWKQFLDQWIAAWSKVLEQAMGTETFAQAMGKQMESFLNTSGPVKKAAEQQIDAGLAGLGLPSRSQVIGVAAQIVQLEDKVDGLEDRLDAVAKELRELTAAVKAARA
jgi:hypothetical protein